MRILRTKLLIRAQSIVLIFGLQLAFSTEAGAQRETLPDIARLLAGQPVYQVRHLEVLPDTLEELVSKSHLVVFGRVEDSKVYLSQDQRDLYTDYSLTPIGTAPTRLSSQAPVLTGEPIVVKRWGGRTTIGSVPVTIEESYLRFFRSGDHLILFLSYNGNERKYEIVGGGAFEVVGERIRAFLSHPRHEAFNGHTLVTFVAEIAKANSPKLAQ
jgi:hypothetical protein